MTDLAELLERVKAASGPDRELDEALALTFGWTLREIRLVRVVLEWERPSGFRLPIGTMADPPFFTASLDAALALVERVLPACDWRIQTQGERKGFYAVLVWSGGPPAAQQAPTAPLALLAALLTALSHVDVGSAPLSGETK